MWPQANIGIDFVKFLSFTHNALLGVLLNSDIQDLVLLSCNVCAAACFLVLLILASQRIEVVIAEWFQNEKLKEWLSHDVTVKRGSTPTMVEWAILAWVAGMALSLSKKPLLFLT